MQSTDIHSGAVNLPDLFDKLNTQQKEAVSLGWGPSLVVAGAGSGKTTVLTRRVAYLLSHLKQSPYSVLAVTFTNKAAAQMKERLQSIVGESVAKKLTIGTFHSICARLLRREIAGYKSPDGCQWKSNFVIYDETDSLAVLKGVISRLNLDEKVFAPREMRNAISSLKNDGMTAHVFAQEAKNYRDGRLSDIFNNYQAELARNNALDFDDLILLFTELLESNDEVRQRLNEQFRHILVDEFQDTNQSQYRLIRLLCAKDALKSEASWEQRSLMVVGDVDQSIYSWRKADFRIILGYQNDFKSATVIKLEENYRSNATILEAANSIIVNNTERIDKVLRCNRGQGGKVQCYAASDEIDEAYYVVEELKRLLARGLKLADTVLLYRTNAQSRAIEEVLVRSHVPYTMVGGTRFYDRMEIKDVIAYLKVVYNREDGQAFQRIINTPRRGLGKTTLDRLAQYAQEQGISLIEAALAATSVGDISAKAAKTLSDFANAVSRWSTMSGVMGVAALLELVLRESGYLKWLEDEANQTKEETAMARVENVRELLAVAQEFESIADEPTLEAFLTRISLVSDLDSMQENQDAVKMMTLHSAKGLEFPTVFLMGLEEGLFPHIRSLNSPAALEEERRLMYVGITRAEDRLYLTYARRRTSFASGSFSGPSYTVPSRFLSEIKPECLSGFQADPESAFRAGYGMPSSEQTGRYGDSYGGRGGYSQGGGYSQAGGYGSGSGNRGYGSGSQDNERSRQSFGKSRWETDETAARKPVEKPRVLSRTKPGESSGGADAFAKATNFERLKPGDRVMHSKFGTGTVKRVIGEGDKELYDINFEAAGNRTMDPKYAKLVKLD